MIVPESKKMTRTICAALSLSFTALAFTPLHIFASNALEFDYSLTHVLKVSLLASTLAALLIFLLTFGLPRRLNEKSVAVTSMLAILVWIQGNVLVWPYGVLDGRDIPWQRFRIQGIVDVVVWVALLIVAWAASAFLSKQAAKIALLLLVIQSLSTGMDLLHIQPLTGRKNFEFDYSGEFVFSSSKNVLLLLPDAFQGNVFQELISAEPGWKGSFPGFTHYPNALGGYAYTMFSVPYLLTGQMYDKNPSYEFARRAFKKSLPGVLRQNGFRSEFYPLMFDLIDFNPGLASNLLPKKIISLAEFSFLYDVALFRSLPQPGKKLIYNNQLWFLKRLFPYNRRPADRAERRGWKARMKKARLDFFSLYDKNLAADMEAQANAGTVQPVFKYFHLRGLHLPLFMNGECRFQRLPPTRENYLTQARCCLDSIRGILDALKKIGVYERTMIIIVGDHGVGAQEVEFRFDLYQPAPPPGPVNRRLATLKAMAMPLFLVKPFGAGSGDPFRQSLAPVTLGDIPKSVVDALQIKENFPGESIFSLGEYSKRPRRFIEGAVVTWQKEAVNYEYLVDGLGWLDSSWRLVAVNRIAPTGKPSRSHEAPADNDAAGEGDERP